MHEKERKNFDEINNGANGNKSYLNPMYVSANNPGQIYSKGNKHGKVMLNPLGNNNPNKFEVSIKATVEINNRMPPIIGNKKIKLSQIQEKGEYE